MFVNMMGVEDMAHETQPDNAKPANEWKPLRSELSAAMTRGLLARPPRQDQLYQLIPIWKQCSERTSEAEPRSSV